MTSTDNPLGGGTIWAPRQRAVANGGNGGGGIGLDGGGGRMMRGNNGRGGGGRGISQREAMQRRMAAARQNMTPEQQQQMMAMQQQQQQGRLGGRGGRFGRGRGRGGRGRMQQQQQQQARRPTSYLEVFTVNELIRLKIMSALTDEERKLLGSVYPMFTPREPSPQQKKMMEERNKKIAEAKKAQEKRKAEMTAKAAASAHASEEEKQKLADEEKKVAEEEERIALEEKEDAGGIALLKEIENFKDGTEVPGTDSTTPDTEGTEVGKETVEDGNKAVTDDSGKDDEEEKKAEGPTEETIAAARARQLEMMKANRKRQEESLAANLTDPHTLLARLNSRRLFNRLQYLRKHNKSFDVSKAYPFNKTTEQIAIAEWGDILNEYTSRHQKLYREQQEKAEEEKRLANGGNEEVMTEPEKEGPVDTDTTIEAVETKSNANEDEEEEIVVEPVGGLALESIEKSMKEVALQPSDGDDQNDLSKDDMVVENADKQLTEDTKDENNEEKKKEDNNKLRKPTILTLPSKCELLMFSPCPRAVAVLASYPRSGNSLMRTLYERTTLRVSGSDMRGGLQKHDLVGEAATRTNCVQFVKTHYPERMGAPPFRVDRAVLLVRNPYDAMESYFNLMTTNSHNTTLSDEARKKHEKIFADMAKKEILVWRDFHEYWLRQKIPILVIRYEDLIRYTDQVMTKVIKFVLEVKSMNFFEERIDRCIREEQIERLGSYKPRSGGIGRSLTKGVYSPKLLADINCGIMNTMEKFGYSEMLVPNPSEWKNEPLDDLGVELIPTERQPLVINQQGLVRTAQRNTDWRAVKQQMTDQNANAAPPKLEGSAIR
jgi:hypothetical protein